MKLDMWHCLLDVYGKFQIDISKHVQKSLENFSLEGSPAKLLLLSIFVCQKAKSSPTMTKISRGQETHHISDSVKFEGSV